MEKYMPLVKALFDFLLKLLKNVGFDKFDAYVEDVQGIAGAAQDALKD